MVEKHMCVCVGGPKGMGEDRLLGTGHDMARGTRETKGTLRSA